MPDFARLSQWVYDQLSNWDCVFCWYHPDPRDLRMETAVVSALTKHKTPFDKPRTGGWRRACEFHPTDTTSWEHVVEQHGEVIDGDLGLWEDEEPSRWPRITAAEIAEKLQEVWENPPVEP